MVLPEVEYALDFILIYGGGEWQPYGLSPFVQAFGGDLMDWSDFQSANGVLHGSESVRAYEFMANQIREILSKIRI